MVCIVSILGLSGVRHTLVHTWYTFHGRRLGIPYHHNQKKHNRHSWVFGRVICSSFVYLFLCFQLASDY